MWIENGGMKTHPALQITKIPPSEETRGDKQFGGMKTHPALQKDMSHWKFDMHYLLT